MNILPIKSGAALALTVVGVVAGVASGAHHRCPPRRVVTITKTKIVYARLTALSTTNAPPVAALVSQRLAALGTNITSPRGPYLARPTKITFSTGYLGLRRPPDLGRLGAAGCLRERHRPHTRLAAKRIR
jgi:hypothetical protein